MLLRRHRLAAGLSQEVLAERARMSSVGIGALERGIRQSPYRETVALLAKGLGLSPTATAELEAAAERPRPPSKPRVHAPAFSANDVAPLRLAAPAPNNLPLQLTSFVGRQTEVAEIAALLDTHRLVTIVGSGGIGKTRASLQVAAQRLDGWSDGVWFIELAPLTNGDYLPTTVAQVLSISPAMEDPVAELVRSLSGKQALLVFDNCEHILEPAARLVSTILRACPRVKVIASSRQALGIVAEATYRIPSLDLPPEEDVEDLPAAVAMQFAAIALFCERARAIDKNFVLTDETAPNVAGICRRLDGIPLAIELAASRVNILSPRQLRERLDEKLRLLTGGSRDVLPRHRTLRALIDWSHDLLDERERALFRRLGIFRKGFSLEGAVAVGSSQDLAELDAFDALASLVDKSLVLAEPNGDSLRYRLLESTRAYACEKLSDSGDGDPVADRHLRHLCSSFAELRQREEKTTRGAELDAALAAQLEDVRSALDRALEWERVSSGGALLADIGSAWNSLGLINEGITRNEMFLAVVPHDNPLLRARLSSALSELLEDAVLWARALEAAAQAVADGRASGDGTVLAFALAVFARANVRLGRFDDAEKALTEAEAIRGAPASVRARFLWARALVSFRTGDFDAGARFCEQQLNEQRALGNVRGEQVALMNLAENEYSRGHTQRAIALARENLPGFRRGADKECLAALLCNLAAYLAAAGDLAGAVETACESIALLAIRNPGHTHIAAAIEVIALVRALKGDLAWAATLEGYVAAALQRIGCEREPTETVTHQRLMTLLRDGLAPDELTRRTAEGAAHFPEAAIALAVHSI
jgi:predicted ATPase/transcriptional regulator with XRE-family HTH domain